MKNLNNMQNFKEYKKNVVKFKIKRFNDRI